MLVHDEERNYVTTKCDTCDVEAPPAVEILQGHGLVAGFGWYCSGGAHICASCPHPSHGWPEPVVPRKERNER